MAITTVRPGVYRRPWCAKPGEFRRIFSRKFSPLCPLVVFPHSRTLIIRSFLCASPNFAEKKFLSPVSRFYFFELKAQNWIYLVEYLITDVSVIDVSFSKCSEYIYGNIGCLYVKFFKLLLRFFFTLDLAASEKYIFVNNE